MDEDGPPPPASTGSTEWQYAYPNPAKPPVIVHQDEIDMAELKRLVSRMNAAARVLKKDPGPVKSASYSEADVLKLFWTTDMLRLMRTNSRGPEGTAKPSIPAFVRFLRVFVEGCITQISFGYMFCNESRFQLRKMMPYDEFCFVKQGLTAFSGPVDDWRVLSASFEFEAGADLTGLISEWEQLITTTACSYVRGDDITAMLDDDHLYTSAMSATVNVLKNPAKCGGQTGPVCDAVSVDGTRMLAAFCLRRRGPVASSVDDLLQRLNKAGVKLWALFGDRAYTSLKIMRIVKQMYGIDMLGTGMDWNPTGNRNGAFSISDGKDLPIREVAPAGLSGRPHVALGGRGTQLELSAISSDGQMIAVVRHRYYSQLHVWS